MLLKLSTLLLALMLSATAVAAPPGPAPGSAEGGGKSINKEQAATIVRKNSQGKLLDLRRQGDSYKAKVLDQGRVQVYEIDSQTGEIRK